MITVEEAQNIIAQTIHDFGIEEVQFDQAIGRVLREDLFADRDLPPYNRVTMDGIAIQYQSFEKGNRNFNIEGIAPAGAPQMTLQNGDSCLEVMTGSILPNNTDTVIRYEDLEIKDGVVNIMLETLKNKQNVHRKGEDRWQNSKIVSAPKVISSAEIGVAATVGKSTLKITRSIGSKINRTLFFGVISFKKINISLSKMCFFIIIYLNTSLTNFIPFI